MGDLKDFIQLLIECLFTSKDCHRFSPGEWAAIIVGGTLIALFLFSLLRTINKIERQRRLQKDLHPYFSKTVVRDYTKYYIQSTGQQLSPSRGQEPIYAFDLRVNLIPMFINEGFSGKYSDTRFYIILADTGMGKTSFMINLYMHYTRKRFFKSYKIVLLPFDSTFNILEEISKIQEQTNTILLLDGLDEDLDAVKNFNSRIKDIIKEVKSFREVVLTCRTQFFSSDEDETIETGIKKFDTEKGQYIFQKIYLSPFNDSDINKFLNQKYPLYKFWKYRDRRKAYRIVKQSPNLMMRPMLLRYIDDLIISKRQYTYTFQIYEELIKRWIGREANRVPIKRHESVKKDLYKFSKKLALIIYEKRETNKNLSVHIDEILPLAERIGIDLESWELTGRSLLNRDSAKHYKFAHKSILEYFLAILAAKNKYSIDFSGFDFAQKIYDTIQFLSFIKQEGNILLYDKQYDLVYNERLKVCKLQIENYIIRIKQQYEENKNYDLISDVNIYDFHDGLRKDFKTFQLITDLKKKTAEFCWNKQRISKEAFEIDLYLQYLVMFDLFCSDFFTFQVIFGELNTPSTSNKPKQFSFHNLNTIRDISIDSNISLTINNIDNESFMMPNFIQYYRINFLNITSFSSIALSSSWNFPNVKMLSIQCEDSIENTEFIGTIFSDVKFIYIQCDSLNLSLLNDGLKNNKFIHYLILMVKKLKNSEINDFVKSHPECIVYSYFDA